MGNSLAAYPTARTVATGGWGDTVRLCVLSLPNIESLKQVEAMDFDVLAPGHGPLGRKEHVRMYREYMEDLRAEVLKYAREGKSLEEMKTSIKLPKYEQWAGYQQMFPLNIEGIYQHVQMHRRPNP
jgi:glyoxylase-like metal-dependent hydrolase (beta-lactamase superfamily II)